MPKSALKPVLATIVALPLVSVSCGCGRNHDHDHDHDHDQPAHEDPAHRPRDFPDAVDRLIAGQAKVREALTGGRIDELHDNLLLIQRDLAEWLPEIAADSDMPEPLWNRVDALSSPLLETFEAALDDLEANPSAIEDRLAQADLVLDELQRLRDEADPAWFPTSTAMTGD